jgi:hypothetical protein
LIQVEQFSTMLDPKLLLKSVDASQDGGVIAEIKAAIRAHQPTRVTIRNYNKDGTLFWNELSIAPDVQRSGSTDLPLSRDSGMLRIWSPSRHKTIDSGKNWQNSQRTAVPQRLIRTKDKIYCADLPDFKYIMSALPINGIIG